MSSRVFSRKEQGLSFLVGKLLTMSNPNPDLPPLQMWCKMLVSMSDDNVRCLYATALEASARDQQRWKKHLLSAEDEVRVRNLSL